MTDEQKSKGFEDLPKWSQLLIVTAIAILAILLGLLMVIMPIYLCIVQNSWWHLLWYCIPLGIVTGFSFYFNYIEEVDE